MTNREKIAIYIPKYRRERDTLSVYSQLRLTFHKVAADTHSPSSGARAQTLTEGHRRRTSREIRPTRNKGNDCEWREHRRIWAIYQGGTQTRRETVMTFHPVVKELRKVNQSYDS